MNIQQGIEIQSSQLKEWEALLKPEIYEELVARATKYNHKAKDGFDILRGDSLGTIMSNWSHKNANAQMLFHLLGK